MGESYNPDAYRYCSGYQYDDRTVVGFAHTHFNGTGHSDLGDVLVIPTVGELRFVMSDRPSGERGTAASARPNSMSR